MDNTQKGNLCKELFGCAKESAKFLVSAYEFIKKNFLILIFIVNCLSSTTLYRYVVYRIQKTPVFFLFLAKSSCLS